MAQNFPGADVFELDDILDNTDTAIDLSEWQNFEEFFEQPHIAENVNTDGQGAHNTTQTAIPDELEGLQHQDSANQIFETRARGEDGQAHEGTFQGGSNQQLAQTSDVDLREIFGDDIMAQVESGASHHRTQSLNAYGSQQPYSSTAAMPPPPVLGSYQGVVGQRQPTFGSAPTGTYSEDPFQTRSQYPSTMLEQHRASGYGYFGPSGTSTANRTLYPHQSYQPGGEQSDAFHNAEHPHTPRRRRPGTDSTGTGRPTGFIPRHKRGPMASNFADDDDAIALQTAIASSVASDSAAPSMVPGQKRKAGAVEPLSTARPSKRSKPSKFKHGDNAVNALLEESSALEHNTSSCRYFTEEDATEYLKGHDQIFHKLRIADDDYDKVEGDVERILHDKICRAFLHPFEPASLHLDEHHQAQLNKAHADAFNRVKDFLEHAHSRDLAGARVTKLIALVKSFHKHGIPMSALKTGKFTAEEIRDDSMRVAQVKTLIGGYQVDHQRPCIEKLNAIAQIISKDKLVALDVLTKEVGGDKWIGIAAAPIPFRVMKRTNVGANKRRQRLAALGRKAVAAEKKGTEGQAGQDEEGEVEGLEEEVDAEGEPDVEDGDYGGEEFSPGLPADEDPYDILQEEEEDHLGGSQERILGHSGNSGYRSLPHGYGQNSAGYS